MVKYFFKVFSIDKLLNEILIKEKILEQGYSLP